MLKERGLIQPVPNGEVNFYHHEFFHLQLNPFKQPPVKRPPILGSSVFLLFLAELHNYRNRTTCMHRNRNPNFFLLVKMASGMDQGMCAQQVLQSWITAYMFIVYSLFIVVY